MKVLILIISVFLPIICFANQIVKVADVEKRNGFFYLKNNNKLYSGDIVDHHSNGNIKVTASLKQGIPDGIETQWWQNGTKRSTTIYKRGKLEGIRKKWTSSGVMWFEAEFKNGRLNGTRTIWHNNGVLFTKTEYVKGKMVDGIIYSYNINGEASWRNTYLNDEVIKTEYYCEDGNISAGTWDSNKLEQCQK